MAEIKCDPDLLQEVVLCERAYRNAQDALSQDILQRSPFKKNDVVRDKDTGCRYRIDGGHGFISGGVPHLSLRGYRVYTTGRREATSSTSLSPSRLEKVP